MKISLFILAGLAAVMAAPTSFTAADDLSHELVARRCGPDFRWCRKDVESLVKKDGNGIDNDLVKRRCGPNFRWCKKDTESVPTSSISADEVSHELVARRCGPNFRWCRKDLEGAVEEDTTIDQNLVKRRCGPNFRWCKKDVEGESNMVNELATRAVEEGAIDETGIENESAVIDHELTKRRCGPNFRWCKKDVADSTFDFELTKRRCGPNYRYCRKDLDATTIDEGLTKRRCGPNFRWCRKDEAELETSVSV